MCEETPRDLGNSVNTNVTASIQVNDVANILVYVKVDALVVGRGITAKSVSFACLNQVCSILSKISSGKLLDKTSFPYLNSSDFFWVNMNSKALIYLCFSYLSL